MGKLTPRSGRSGAQLYLLSRTWELSALKSWCMGPPAGYITNAVRKHLKLAIECFLCCMIYLPSRRNQDQCQGSITLRKLGTASATPN